MFFTTRIKNQTLRCTLPDYTSERQGKHLLIWKDIPHWMVVDNDFYTFLTECTGGRTVDMIINQHPEWKFSQHEMFLAIQNLLSLGILRNSKNNNAINKITKSPPVQIENIALNITRKCNLRCSFCYNLNYLNRNSKMELHAEEIITFLKTTRPFLSRTPSLTILGGEPLLATEKLLAVADYGTRHGFMTLLSTNGTRITDNFAKHAKKTGLQVQVSIDGHNAELNDAGRGKGVFEEVVRGIKILVKHGVYTILSMVCYQNNIAYLEDFYRFADSLKVNEARFIPLKKMGGATDTPIKPASTRKMIEKSVAIFKQNPEFRKLTGRDCFSIIANTCRYSNKRPSCGTGLQTFLLDSDGWIYPCLNTNMPEFRVANIREKDFDFARIWANSPVLDTVRTASSIESMNTTCSECLVRYWCLGGCRGETYAVTGKLNGKSNNCGDLRTSIIEMFWILSEQPDLVRSAISSC